MRARHPSSIRVVRLFLLFAPALALIAAVSGCDEAYPPDLKYALRVEPILGEPMKTEPKRFDAPGQLQRILDPITAPDDRRNILDPLNIPAQDRQRIEAVLEQHFGTPANPKVGGIDDGQRAALKLDDAILVKGSKLYRLHCLHCHGVNGNGRGPTAPWVNPHPRDYRQGLFKFTSVNLGQNAQRRARRADLVRTLREGIEGTTMPSFGLLPDDQIEAMVSYVIHLSMRGYSEYDVMRKLLRKDLEASEIVQYIEEGIKYDAENWLEADRHPIEPPPPPADFEASVIRGFEQFANRKMDGGTFEGIGCIKCHTDYGRATRLFYDDWGTIVRAANLVEGPFRGGRRPIDLYYRIHGGISGANMASNSDRPPNQIWDLVHFVSILPYPEMRKKLNLPIE